jgi:hypothetical protein
MADKRILMPVKLVDASGLTTPTQLKVSLTGDAVANASAGGILVFGSDGSNYRVLSTDTGGKLNVNCTQSGSPWGVTGSGTAGSPASGVVTVQGIASMTAVKVDGSGVTQPVSGTVTANIGTAGSLALDATAVKLNVAQGAGTGSNTGPMIQAVATTVSPTYTTATINPLSLDTAGNLRVNVVTGGTSGTVAQGSSTSGQQGMLVQGAVTTAAPTYTTAQTSPLSLTTSGLLRVDGSGVTQPVSGTVTANAGTGTFTVSGTVTANAGTGTLNVAGTGSAGSPAAGVVSVQGVSSGTALSVTDQPTNPVNTATTSAAVAAGASVTLATGNIKAKYLWGIDITSSVSFKAVIGTVANGVTTSVAVLFGRAGETIDWEPCHRRFFQSGNTAGTDGFSVVITNQDTSDAADVYATFYTADN